MHCRSQPNAGSPKQQIDENVYDVIPGSTLNPNAIIMIETNPAYDKVLPQGITHYLLHVRDMTYIVFLCGFRWTQRK